MVNPLRPRLVRDIAEIKNNPYPNIDFHADEQDITKACLTLTAERYGPIHTTMEFPPNFPLEPPTVRMDCAIDHPNVFDDYICTTILQKDADWSPAYTIKAMAIQLLSFFSSDTVDQDYGNPTINLRYYQKYRFTESDTPCRYHCTKCQFDCQRTEQNSDTLTTRFSPLATLEFSPAPIPAPLDRPFSKAHETSVEGNTKRKSEEQATPDRKKNPRTSLPIRAVRQHRLTQMEVFPDEILLQICEKLETDELLLFAEAWSKIGKLITNYDVIRTRELQCFCLKKDYLSTKLGVGVSVNNSKRTFTSEFDLLSEEAFITHGIRQSVQGVPFTHYLSLPISQGHWRRTQANVGGQLVNLRNAARLGNIPIFKVIYHFMNSIIVTLTSSSSSSLHQDNNESTKSTLLVLSATH